jgi:hypothetical protein
MCVGQMTVLGVMRADSTLAPGHQGLAEGAKIRTRRLPAKSASVPSPRLITRGSGALGQRMIVGFITFARIIQVRLACGDMAIGAFLAFLRSIRGLGSGNRYHGATENGKCKQDLKQFHGILLGERIIYLTSSKNPKAKLCQLKNNRGPVAPTFRSAYSRVRDVLT